MSTSVKVFQSTDTGAPICSGTTGALIAILDACLQNGYGTVTIDSLVVASNVATVTDVSGHGFTAIGNVGPVIRIAGATPAELNGDWRITVVSTTVFTFATTVIIDQTATGTITAKRAPLGFTKAFSGTNLAAYRSDDITSTRFYLRIDDANTINAKVRGYEVLTDINTGTGVFPSTERYACKSAGANSTARPWRLIGDGCAFYLIVNTDSSGYFDMLVFGDIISYKSGDAYHCWIYGETAATSYGNDTFNAVNNASATLARSYTQTGGEIASARYSHWKSTGLGNNGSVYPNPVDNGFHAWPVEVWESTTSARGLAPGLWSPIHIANSIANGTVITDVPQLSGRSLLVAPINTVNYRVAFDITGPWR